MSKLTIPEDADQTANYTSPEEGSEEASFLATSMSNKVTATLVNAGPAGISAASAIISGRSKKRPHTFETNPAVRKRHTTRLLRKIRHTLEEFAARVGQQAVVLAISPVESNHNYKVYGTKPLLDIVRNLQPSIMDELRDQLTKRTPPQVEEDPALYPLPPLDIDGIPTPVEKMTQAQLRTFIPHMLKYSTLRGKPGWGRESTKPPWWPTDLPWANVRMDVRSESEKQKVSWTHALRRVVLNCYKYHGRGDLLPVYSEDEVITDIKVEECRTTSVTKSTVNQSTMNLHTVTNEDGTVSLVQIDPSNPLITLPDGSTARVEVMTMMDEGDVQTTVTIDSNDKNNSTLGVYNQGQLYLTGDGQLKEILGLCGGDSLLNNKGTNILQLTTDSDGVMYVTPIRINKFTSNNGDLDNGAENETNSALVPIGNQNSEELYQVYSMTNGTVTLPNNIKLEGQ